jgi:hypothetical protein
MLPNACNNYLFYYVRSTFPVSGPLVRFLPESILLATFSEFCLNLLTYLLTRYLFVRFYKASRAESLIKGTVKSWLLHTYLLNILCPNQENRQVMTVEPTAKQRRPSLNRRGRGSGRGLQSILLPHCWYKKLKLVLIADQWWQSSVGATFIFSQWEQSADDSSNNLKMWMEVGMGL